MIKPGKTVIIGAGHVGSAVLNSLLRMNITDEIILINRNRDRALGEVMDARHTLAFAYSANANIRVGSYEDCADANIIVNTAAPNIPGGCRDRMTLLKTNVDVISDIMENIVRYTREAIIINAANPLDILTYVMQKKFNYDPAKIIGTGTLLDTARFNKIIGDICRVDAKNVTGFVLGEHGSTAFIPWNCVNIVGIPFGKFEKQFSLKEPINKEAILSEMKSSGLDILRLKGFTSSGISLSVCRIIGCVLRNERAVLPVCTSLFGPYGLKDVAMSLPAIVGKDGAERVLELPLDEQGKKDLLTCYDYLHGILENIEL